MITKLYEFYRMLTERAFNIEDTKNCILVHEVNKNEVKLCLYEYVNQYVIGYITADTTANSDFFIIDRVSADKGWGPFMYTLLLQMLYPKGVKPSHIIKPVAHNVWKNFLKHPNIITKPLPTTDNNYADKWVPAKGFSNDGYVENDTEIINTIFSMSPLPWFQPFLSDSAYIIKEKNIDHKKVFKQCLDFFYNKYYATTESVSIPSLDLTGKYLMVMDKGASVQFMIQDKSKIYGYAELLKKHDYYQVINIAAEQGFGPFLYDTIMLCLDKPIRPNHSLTTEAWRVWTTYLNQRPDVSKTPVTTDVWNDIDLDQKMNTKSSFVEPINYLYTITDGKRKQFATDWLNVSKQQFVKPMTEKLPKWKETRFNQGKMWFNTKYPMYR